MKRLSTWDTYVTEARAQGDRSIELPLTDDETYIVPFPTRRQGRTIARAQNAGDVDAMLIALLGAEAGGRVRELAEDQPTYVLDEFLIDVMRKFGMLPDDDTDTNGDTEDDRDIQNVSAPARATVSNGRVNGGKPPAARVRKPAPRKPSARSSTASR